MALRRHETTITPGGHRIGGSTATTKHSSSSSTRPGRLNKPGLPRDTTETPLARRSLVFVESERLVRQGSSADLSTADDSDVEEVTLAAMQARLAQFK
jgi:hypothetical protein